MKLTLTKLDHITKQAKRDVQLAVPAEYNMAGQMLPSIITRRRRMRTMLIKDRIHIAELEQEVAALKTELLGYRPSIKR